MKPEPRFFQTFNGCISLATLRDQLQTAAQTSAPLPLATLQNARDIVEYLLFDDITYHADIMTYLPQQTQERPSCK